MAFPEVRSSRLTVVGSNSTSWTIEFPQSPADIKDGGSDYVVAGDLILVSIGRDGNGTTASITGGFSTIFNNVVGTAARGITFAKVAAGTEGNFTFTTNSEQGVARVVVIKNWYGALTGVEVSANATGTDAAPDPANLAPSWGAADTYWRAFAAHDSGLRSITAYPTNFTDNQNSDASGGGNGAGLGSAGNKLNASSLNPTAFTLDSADDWIAWVIAIRPSTAYTGSVSESASATDSPTSVRTTLGSSSESGSANETENSVGTFGSSRTEAASSTDVPSSSASVGAAGSEAASATESQSASISGSSSVSESSSASDAQSASLTSLGDINESASADDVSVSSFNGDSDTVETGSATDTQTNSITGAGAVSESTTTTEIQSSLLVQSESISEGVSSGETSDAVNVLLSDTTEAANVQDLSDGVVVGSVVITEDGLSDEIINALFIGNPEIEEAATADELSDGVIAGSNPSVTETASATESLDTSLITGVNIVEPASASTIISANLEVSLPDVLQSGASGNNRNNANNEDEEILLVIKSFLQCLE